MKNTICLLSLLLVLGCIDQIEIATTPEDPLVVVDGVFTDLEEPQIIRISESIPSNSQIPAPVSNARIYVEDQDGNRVTFVEGERREYWFFGRSKPNKQYRLLGVLPDGREISSTLQSVPPSFPLTEISIVDTLVTFTDESGDKRRVHSIDFYARSFVSTLESKQYLRFSPETVYQISEIVCGPFDQAETCYIYNDVRPPSVNLLEVDPSNDPILFNNFVYRRKIDIAMGEIFALDLRLYSYNKAEYEYWEKLKLIFDQNRNITDSTPARITGNITANDGSEVQGQFAVVGKSRLIEIVRNSDFPTQQLPYCGLPGLRPYPLPNGCCGCRVLSGATTNRPDYWS